MRFFPSTVALGLIPYFLFIFFLTSHALESESEHSFPKEKIERLEHRSATTDDTYLVPRAEHVKGDVLSTTPKLFRRGRPWTAEEEYLLTKLRDEGTPWTEMEKYFPDRSWKALHSKHYSLVGDLPKPGRTEIPWTPEENERLLGLVEGGVPWKEVAKLFPRRTLSGIQSHYGFLKSGELASTPAKARNKFTAEEDKLLSELVGVGRSWSEIAKFFPVRSTNALRSRYRLLGKSPQKPRWTAEEDKLLLELVGMDRSWSEIAKFFPRRTLPGIQSHYGFLKSGELASTPAKAQNKFTAEENKLLLDLGGTDRSWTEIAKSFPERSITYLKSRYRLLGGSPRQRRWTAEEDKLLLEALREDMKQKEIAKLLGRSYSAVVNRIRRLRARERVEKARSIEESLEEASNQRE